jgi:catechol 2,3-dioxygenase-like lactoylglutathione lyase family enzyme
LWEWSKLTWLSDDSAEIARSDGHSLHLAASGAGGVALECRNLRHSVHMIQHVTREIPPSQLDACLHFYALLGLEPVPAPDAVAGRAVWLAPAGERRAVQLHLMPAADARPAQGHVAFVIADYEATLAKLRRAGHEVEPRREHWGAPRAYVRDPAANVVEVMARAPEDP